MYMLDISVQYIIAGKQYNFLYFFNLITTSLLAKKKTIPIAKFSVLLKKYFGSWWKNIIVLKSLSGTQQRARRRIQSNQQELGLQLMFGKGSVEFRRNSKEEDRKDREMSIKEL